MKNRLLPQKLSDRLQQRTTDGLRLKNVARALERLTFVSIKTNDPYVDYVAQTPAFPVPCILSKYTSAMEEVVPWVMSITGYQDSERVYRALQKGSWN